MATKQRIPNPATAVGDAIATFDDIADAIANPDPARPLRNAVGGSGRLFCDFLGAAPNAAGLLLGAGMAAGGLLCKPYWDKNNYSQPNPTGGVNGGQCNKTYTFFAQRKTATGAYLTSANVSRQGPITGITKTANGGGNFIDRYVVSGPNISSGITDISYVSGGQTRLQGPFPAGSTAFDYECGQGSGTGLEPGQNPPPTPAPFPPGEDPGTDPDGQPFFFVPPIDPAIPGTDPTPVPEIEPGGDGGNGGGPSDPPTGTDGGEGDAPGGDEPFEDPPPGERWVGCCITLIEEPAAVGVVPSSGSEKIYTTVYGNLRLVFDSLSGSGYDTPIQIRARTTCVWEPVRGLEPTGVRINLNPGFRYRLTKYSVPVEN